MCVCVCVWATGKAFHIQLLEMLLAQNVGIINVAGMAFAEELALVISGRGGGKNQLCVGRCRGAPCCICQRHEYLFLFGQKGKRIHGNIQLLKLARFIRV